MGRFQKLFIFILVLPLLLSATVSTAKETNHPGAIKEVQVIYHRGASTLQRVYVQPHKISSILNYLRLLKIRGQTDMDPEQLSGESFTIILYDGDGQRSIYRQRANKYFSKNSKPWKRIDPSQGCLLHSILQSLPTDKTHPSASG